MPDGAHCSGISYKQEDTLKSAEVYAMPSVHCYVTTKHVQQLSNSDFKVWLTRTYVVILKWHSAFAGGHEHDTTFMNEASSQDTSGPCTRGDIATIHALLRVIC
jgi:hypothetical protein